MLAVACSVRILVLQTHLVATAVDAKLCGCCDSTAEEEERVQHVESHWDGRVEHEALNNGGRDEVEKRKHREDGAEHVVVDDRWVARVCGCDHVTNQRHDQQSPEELKPAQGEVDDRESSLHFDCCMD